MKQLSNTIQFRKETLRLFYLKEQIPLTTIVTTTITVIIRRRKITVTITITTTTTHIYRKLQTTNRI